jgi:beta-barrel assembly-enhancing protease
MSRRRFLQAACGCAALGCGSLLGMTLPARLTPGFRPDAASDENGLWDQFEKEEAKLKRSKFLVKDPELNAYVSSLVCKVAGDFCRDVRVYLVRSPYFNATMAPNGMMQIWTGCLLRCQSEAQLAAVVGHEIGHYLRRHGVERFRDAQQKSALSTILGLGLSVAGGVRYSGLADAVILASAFAYNRDQEREADTMGLELCSACGYDPEEAANVWAHLIAERKARENQGFRDLIFATHPVEEEREEKLRAAAKGLPGCGVPERRGRERYLQVMRRERASFFADELKLRDYGASVALFGRMLESEPRDLDVAFNLAEVYRLRAKEGDDAKALEHLDRLATQPAAPAETWRSIGLVRRSRGETQEAAQAFARYLELKPHAEDAAMIRSYVNPGRNS